MSLFLTLMPARVRTFSLKRLVCRSHAKRPDFIDDAGSSPWLVRRSA